MYKTKLKDFYTPNPYIGGKYSNIDRYEKIFIDIDREKFKDKVQELNKNNIILYDYVEIHKSMITNNLHLFYNLTEPIDNETYYFVCELFDDMKKPFMYKITHQMLYDYYSIFGSDPMLKNKYNQPFRYNDNEKQYIKIKDGMPINIENLFSALYRKSPKYIKEYYIKYILIELSKLNDEFNNIKFLFSPADYVGFYKTKSIVKTSPSEKILKILSYVVDNIWPIAKGYRQYLTMCFCGMLYRYVSKDKDVIKEILSSVLFGKDEELSKRLTVANYINNKNKYGIPKLLEIVGRINVKYKNDIINILKSKNNLNIDNDFTPSKQIKVNRKRFSNFEILQASVIFILIKYFRQEYTFSKLELRSFLKSYFNVTKKYAFHSRAVGKVLDSLIKFKLLKNVTTRICYINTIDSLLIDKLIENIKYDIMRDQLIIFNLFDILEINKSKNLSSDVTKLLSNSFLWFYNYKFYGDKNELFNKFKLIKNFL